MFVFTALFAIDRYFFMDDRIIENSWSFESGDYMAVDPMHVKQHFELRGNRVYFYKENKKLWVAGCYFGQLFLYDYGTEILTRYSKL